MRWRLVMLLVIAGCSTERWRVNESIINRNATAWPHYANQMPPPTQPLMAPSPESAPSSSAVVLLFPKIEAPQVLHWDGEESFRLVLTQTPASVVKTTAQGRAVGDLRTPNFEVTDAVYAAIRCGFGRTWAGAQSQPKIYAAVYFCRPEEDAREARNAASSVVENVLDGLREQAVKSGANIASDIRCYLVKSPKPHLWCEATGEVAN
jgi:hypothetical protein